MFGLSGDELFKMMTSMSPQYYYEMHSRYPARLDKTKVLFRSMKALPVVENNNTGIYSSNMIY